MRLCTVTVARPHFPPTLVFLFTLCSDGRSNYQSQEEAAMVYRLWGNLLGAPNQWEGKEIHIIRPQLHPTMPKS